MAAAVTYEWPLAVQGGTVAPTATQVGYMVNAIFTWLDADTFCVITHNFGLALSELTGLFPLVSVETDPSSAGTVNAVRSYTKASNTVTISKASAAGTGGTFQVVLQKFNSITR
jgi:hypothetical protein